LLTSVDFIHNSSIAQSNSQRGCFEDENIMTTKMKIRAALMAGGIMFFLNLLVEWLFNRELVGEDYLISVVAGIFVTLLVFLLLRHLTDHSKKD